MGGSHTLMSRFRFIAPHRRTAPPPPPPPPPPTSSRDRR